MKNILFVLLLFAAFPVYAQNVAQPVLPGFLSITNCPGGNTPCYIASGSVPSAVTNSSNTITTGGTFQTISAANPNRKSLEFANICNVAGNCTATTDVCYLYFGVLASAALTNSLAVPPMGDYLRSAGNVQSAAVNVTCTATGDHFYYQEQ